MQSLDRWSSAEDRPAVVIQFEPDLMVTWLRRVLNRLSITLALGWIIYCGVISPWKSVLDQRNKAETEYKEEIADCPRSTNGFSQLEYCFSEAEQNQDKQNATHSFRRMSSVLWPMECLEVLVGLLVIVILNQTCKWIFCHP